MHSYHNDPAVKEKYQQRFAAHRAADEVVQGTGFDNGRGCFVGCTLDEYDHSRFPVELGWPEWLARLAESIFEGLPKAEAPQFGTDFHAAIPVGVDLEPVRFLIAIPRHQAQLARLEGNDEPYAEQCRAAITSVINYCIKMAGDQYANENEAKSAAESALSAAKSAALLVAELAEWSVESAMESAAESVEKWSVKSVKWSALSAVGSAVESAEWSVNWSELSAVESAWQQERDTLLTVLKSLK